MDVRELLIAFILGVIEGLTEFIPVSSTGHMIIVDDILLQSYAVLGSTELANTFKVVIQFGSILAVMIIFWERFLQLIPYGRDLSGDVRDRLETYGDGLKKGSGQISYKHFIVGLLPAFIFGLLLENVIDTYLFRVETVIVGLLLGAILMLVADQVAGEEGRTPVSFENITYKQALFIGLYQCLALWPGFSRSGATIAGGVLLGLNYRAAADFTFMMAVPIMFGASALSLYKKWSLMSADIIPFFVVGFVSAFVFAYISIRFFLALIGRVRLKPFALYRIALAIILLTVFFG